MMKLYELPRNSLFTLDEGELLNHKEQPVYRLERLDGMYSRCFEIVTGKLIHFSVGTPVKPFEA